MLTSANNLLMDAINCMVYEDSTGKEGKWLKKLKQSSVINAKTTSV
jgi:hypothetical protein